jgi:orotate phosphoribosyltransferase
LSYEERQQHWNWCREYIDRECIYRVDTDHPPIPSKAPGGTYVWQFYLRRATFNPEFARRLGLLFWDHFLPIYQQHPFQICACEPSGPPIGSAIQAHASRLGIPLNLFVVRRSHKTFGTDNWFDGRALAQVPVLIVDDIAASSPFMLNASVRIQVKLKLPLHRNYFTIVNKVGRGFSKQAQHTENYLDGQLIALFTMNNFCRDVEQFKDRYGRGPKWSGIVK